MVLRTIKPGRSNAPDRSRLPDPLSSPTPRQAPHRLTLNQRPHPLPRGYGRLPINPPFDGQRLNERKTPTRFPVPGSGHDRISGRFVPYRQADPQPLPLNAVPDLTHLGVDQRVRGAQDFTRDGRIVEFARGVHAASRFSWSYTFKIPE